MACALCLTTWTSAATALPTTTLPAVWAQGGSTGQRVAEIYWGLGLVIAAAVVIVLVALIVRRWLLRSGAEPDAAEGFTLSDLRRMHREGALSDEEFASARASLIARGMARVGPLDRDDDLSAPPPDAPDPLLEPPGGIESDADDEDSDKTGGDRPGRPDA